MKLRKLRKRVLPIFLTLVMSLSSVGAITWAEPNDQAIVESDTSTEQAAKVGNTTKSVCPSYQEAYESMIALKTKYPEGTAWTNFTPYGRDGQADSYIWKGGRLNGVDRGVGCAAFVFILSDEAFENLPARMKNRGQFTFEELKVGDILRTNGNSHFVIILQKSPAGVIVAEGNYNKSVHWGRAIGKEEVMQSDFAITRYPTNFVSPDEGDINEVTSSGTEGNLSWELTRGGTLTISGTGDMPNYTTDSSKRPSWDTHKAAISTIVLENGITNIGDNAFYQSNALDVYIPNSVKNIGQGAFRESALINVTIPGGVEDIGHSAFYESANLVSVSVAEGVKVISDQAFRGCTSLEYIDFPSTITSIGAGAFMSCEMMKSVRFAPGSHSVEIGDNIFMQCWRLMSVTLPQSATKISSGMFGSCSSLFSLYIPASVTEIGDDAFASCRVLRTIMFGGTEAAWSQMLTPYLKASLMSTGTVVQYNVEFDDPFAVDPDDPGDINPIDPDPSPTPVDPTPVDPTPVDPTPVDPTPIDPPAHEHQWSVNWSHDENSHWHECESEDCTVTENAEKNGYDEHIFSEWIVDVEATTEQAGSQHRDCTICAYRENAEIPILDKPIEPTPVDPTPVDPTPIDPSPTPVDPTPDVPVKHTHQWLKNWNYNQTHHWHDCEAEDCPITNNAEKDSYTAHIFGEWVIDSQATVGQKGSKHRVCSTCGYREDTEIPALEESVTPTNTPVVSPTPNPSVTGTPIPTPSEPAKPTTMPDPPAPTIDPTPAEPIEHQHVWSAQWSRDVLHHWHECESENCPTKENSQKDGYDEHIFGEWVIDIEATEEHDGTKYRACTVCGQGEYAVTPMPLPTGKPNPTEHIHSYDLSAKWKYDKTAHWHKCTVPGCLKRGSYAAHSYSSWVVDMKSTTAKKGSEHRDCKICQYRQTASIAKLSGPSAHEIATAKKQLKTQLAGKLKKQVKPQLKKQLKSYLKKPLTAKRKTKVKAKVKTKLRKQLRASLKPQYRQKFGQKMGATQFNKAFDNYFKSEFNKQFNKSFRQLTKTKK